MVDEFVFSKKHPLLVGRVPVKPYTNCRNVYFYNLKSQHFLHLDTDWKIRQCFINLISLFINYVPIRINQIICCAGWSWVAVVERQHPSYINKSKFNYKIDCKWKWYPSKSVRNGKTSSWPRLYSHAKDKHEEFQVAVSYNRVIPKS